MKQERARRVIIREWDQWIQAQPVDSCDATGRHSLKFFVEPQDARSALLNFKARGRYKWQVVHDWLLDARRPSHHTGSGQYQHSIVVTTLPSARLFRSSVGDGQCPWGLDGVTSCRGVRSKPKQICFQHLH